MQYFFIHYPVDQTDVAPILSEVTEDEFNQQHDHENNINKNTYPDSVQDMINRLPEISQYKFIFI